MIGIGQMGFRKLLPQDADEYMRFQQSVYDALENKTWLEPIERWEIEHILAGKGDSVGLFAEERLMGVWLLYDARNTGDSLAPHAGLPEERTGIFEMALLDPALRGHGLHRKMVRQLTIQWLECGQYDYLAASAHPDNLPSVRGFTGAGYHVAATKELYGGKLRHVLTISKKELEKLRNEAREENPYE